MENVDTIKPKILMICTNRRYGADGASCAARSSLEIAEAIETGVRERDIDITVERSVCMGQCTKGPTIRLAPGGRFILGKSLSDADNILDELETLCGRRDSSTLPLHLLGS
jgi:NADH:ubiquinone oxidoreductase subunit E